MSESKAAELFFAYVLMAVGGLIAVLCGGCTSIFFVFGLWLAITTIATTGANGGVSLIVLSASIGGVPTLIGVAIFIVGRAMKRRTDGSKPRNVDETFS